MRQFFEIIADHPWVSLFVSAVGCFALGMICNMFADIFRRKK